MLTKMAPGTPEPSYITGWVSQASEHNGLDIVL